MKDVILKLEAQLDAGSTFLKTADDAELSIKPRLEKWSKKEIFGHLLDSAINNLQRFTEIQFEEKPYTIRPYKMDHLVLANDYQHAYIEELRSFWVSINTRIREVIIAQTEESLAFPIIIGPEEKSDLRFLMTDYVDHLAYHLKQVMD